ncbi:hypothetical protein [uncultured Clostridium sp.]|uniref:hypothetical protein n=1 Tax=uncultured Clostridium sp. TaxID=59620 RepID=UPI00280A7953|nr:hypothetical protein [uncultured Clostridium sp.]
MRQKYDYNSPDCKLEIVKTGNIYNVGKFIGIFAREVPNGNPNGINIRRFESIVQEVFQDCYAAFISNNLTDNHIINLKQISSAIVYWKMTSQGGRAKLKMDNVLAKWNADTVNQLMNAYEKKDMSLFRIGGVRIPTATTFMRFLFPNDFGVMDSRVVGNHTQPNGITALSLRKDGYINDTKQNVIKYETEYTIFLRSQAAYLNELGIKFKDVDDRGKIFLSKFRASDIEMSLF